MESPGKIYLVEDDLPTRLILKKTLENEGYIIVGESSCGEKLLMDLESILPDLIIMDIGLEGKLNGIETSQIVFDKFDVPIIFLSVQKDERTFTSAKKTNPYLFLVKPFNDIELLVNINLCIQKRKLEKKLLVEQLEKSKLITHFENSPDLIIRMDLEKRLLYVNPVIYRFTGEQPSFYSSKYLTECDLPESIVYIINSIAERIIEKGRNIFQENELPTLMGDRNIEVRAHPEVSSAGSIDSIVVIFKDVTDQRIILQDMRNKNKRISDSISYSRQIQEAVIQNKIKKYFKESFVLHKPKDIISGDFPWVIKQDYNVYAAAVDCTGHGIPGALMSLIIYLLLNDITSKLKNSPPGEILDALHDAVNRTLNQMNNESRDGADVALCKIDLDGKKLEFAGARRPLYHITKYGEFNQIKGDRFPIGGTQYTDRGSFSTHTVALNRNDRLFMFSDGYQDQFGGPDNDKTKFGVKRMRELFLNNSDVPMDRLLSILDGSFNDWKKQEKQIDDILVLGIEIDS